MKVNIYRRNPDSGEEGFSSYDLPAEACKGFTVLSIIRYIHENLDPTLGFFSHCVCGRGICGRCLMEINGKLKLACDYVPEDGELTVKPRSKNIFKDLVCK